MVKSAVQCSAILSQEGRVEGRLEATRAGQGSPPKTGVAYPGGSLASVVKIAGKRIFQGRWGWLAGLFSLLRNATVVLAVATLSRAPASEPLFGLAKSTTRHNSTQLHTTLHASHLCAPQPPDYASQHILLKSNALNSADWQYQMFSLSTTLPLVQA